MGFLFERLEVYQKGRIFVNKILSLCNKMPKGNAFLVEQLRRASTSILLNVAEGNGRWSCNDRRHFFAIARGSAFECATILQLCVDNGLISTAVCNDIDTELEEIAKMLTGLIKSNT